MVTESLLSSIRKFGSALLPTDRSGFPLQIQKPPIAKQPSAQHPESTVDQRPSIHRPSSDTSMVGMQQPLSSPSAQHPESTIDQRSIDHPPIHPRWGCNSHSHRPALSIQSQPSTSDHRSTKHLPIHPWWGCNNHSHHQAPNTYARRRTRIPVDEQARGPSEVARLLFMNIYYREANELQRTYGNLLLKT